MKQLFDTSCAKISQLVTNEYSTSFSFGISLLQVSIRSAIYSIYAFVRYADEIVDSFHSYDRSELLTEFISDYHKSLERTISLNPILNSFQEIVNRYGLQELVTQFLNSMKMDLIKSDYQTTAEYNAYIYGSADVVGLMCLKVFVQGDEQQYEELKPYAMKLGSAFQKVNFLRDFKSDYEILGRSYFPNINLNQMDEASKAAIISDIQADFEIALIGVKKLPLNCRLGVYIAYRYYTTLLKKLQRERPKNILTKRIRVSNYLKGVVFCKSYLRYRLNFL